MARIWQLIRFVSLSDTNMVVVVPAGHSSPLSTSVQESESPAALDYEGRPTNLLNPSRPGTCQFTRSC